MLLGFDKYKELRQDAVMTRDINIAVDKIVLTNVLVPQGDDLDYQLMVPAWVVYNHDVWEYNGKNGEGSTMIIAVNATDGSVIDLTFRSHELDAKREERQKEQQAAEETAAQ